MRSLRWGPGGTTLGEASRGGHTTHHRDDPVVSKGGIHLDSAKTAGSPITHFQGRLSRKIVGRKKEQGPQGPLCAVGNGVGERSRETEMVPGGSGGSVSLRGRRCQREMLPGARRSSTASRAAARFASGTRRSRTQPGPLPRLPI